MRFSNDIIPAIYRLNSGAEYEFEQVATNGDIISYGDGVTRQTYTILKEELDIALQNLQSHDHLFVFNLGKLLYFCNKNGKQNVQ